jgi:hypothetical protein
MIKAIVMIGNYILAEIGLCMLFLCPSSYDPRIYRLQDSLFPLSPRSP